MLLPTPFALEHSSRTSVRGSKLPTLTHPTGDECVQMSGPGPGLGYA